MMWAKLDPLQTYRCTYGDTGDEVSIRV